MRRMTVAAVVRKRPRIKECKGLRGRLGEARREKIFIPGVLRYRSLRWCELGYGYAGAWRMGERGAHGGE